MDYIVQSQHNQKCPLISKDKSFLKGGQFDPAETGYFIRRVHFGEQTKGLTFGLLGQGNTVKEAIDDFYNSRDEIEAYYKEIGKPFPDNLEFLFKYDTASLLAYYSNVLSLAGLEKLTGVAQGQLSHYVTGKRKPSPKTVLKIEKLLHQFAAELEQVQLTI